MVQYARNELNLDIRENTLESFETTEKYDLIILVQVIAHFYDLNTVFKKIDGMLNESGLVLIETWNYKSLTAKLLKENWHEYSPPSVLNFLYPELLDIKFDQMGFKKIRYGRPLKMISGQHAKSLLDHKINEYPPATLFKIIQKLIPQNINIPYPSEDLFWCLYRRNLPV